ncbi:unnamed protein product [Heterosigma akashiwo]|mmetsp:Transcript_3469/g.5070  ORF Transcript_3469/g.5070 Transcript_3469/m.5070 type:complete len:83 (+) Transcript_3469:76-324(+)
MNAAIASLRKTAVSRSFATAAAVGKPVEKTFAQIWLSDQGAYPVIGIISGAVALCTAFGLNFMATHPDVRIVKSKRTAILRD